VCVHTACTRVAAHAYTCIRGHGRGERHGRARRAEARKGKLCGIFCALCRMSPFFPARVCLVSLPRICHRLFRLPLPLSLSLFLFFLFVLALARSSSSRSVRDSSLSHFAARFAFRSRAHFPCTTRRQQHTRVDGSRSDPVGESRWMPRDASGRNRDDEDSSRGRLAGSGFPRCLRERVFQMRTRSRSR